MRGETPSKVVAVPLELIQPHPKLAFRFEYEVESLAESIRETADESTPNGQLNPARVVNADGKEGYYVYVGVRRFLALKSLYEKTKDARFGVFNAYVDEGLSELQMFVKAKAENEEEKGERQPLSLLEQVSGIRRIRDGFDPGRASPAIKRLLALANRMEEERLKKLNVAERAVGSGFSPAQLEGLAKLEGGDAEFYTTAASMISFGIADADIASKKRDAAFHLNWFKRAFPEIKQEPKPQTSSSAATAGGSEPEVHEERVLVAPCPRCGGGNMIRVKGEVDVTHISPDPDGKAVTMVADTVSRARLACSHCGGELYAFVRHLEGAKYAISASRADEFREPRAKAEALDLRFDHEEKAWQKIEGEKIAGPLVLAPRKKKR